PSGLVAVTAGWIVTECGRQPFTVYGLLLTADSVSPIGQPGVAASLAVFIVAYFVVFGAGIWFLFRLFGQAPQPHQPGVLPGQPVRTAGITPAPAMIDSPPRTGLAAGPAD
ncbi:MAG: cytochrome ubiquinol oxidase subunit I, partial [Burkholderiaceae bacterium]